MKLKAINFKALRDQVEVITVLRWFNWNWTYKRGVCYRGPCPFHGSTSSKSVSLKVIPRVCFCHKCKFTGDATAVYAKLHGVDVLTAAHQICQRLSIDTPPL